MMFGKVRKDLHALANAEKAKLLQGFFKTGPGQYGEGDVFLGVTVPESRAIAKKHASLSFKDISRLLESNYHEERLVALLLLVHNYQRGTRKEKEAIYTFYLKHTNYVNNWDLVDLTAHKIVGDYLRDKDRAILYRLARSKSLWERRISIVSTFAFIARNDFTDAVKLAELLLHDSHDLMHKAVGWVLREVGKKDEKRLRDFLDRYATTMPRTMLRYAIERLDEKTRKHYMAR